MAEKRIVEFETNPQENRNGESVGMKVRVEIGDDAELAITATSTGASAGESYVGFLTLRKAKREALAGVAEGGDECWVNGVWVSPCPGGDSGP